MNLIEFTDKKRGKITLILKEGDFLSDEGTPCYLHTSSVKFEPKETFRVMHNKLTKAITKK